MADTKDYRELVNYLIKEKISPEVALGIIKRASETRITNHRVAWKMMRFTLYIWARLKEYEKDQMFLPPRIQTIQELVTTKKFKRLWDTFPQPYKFDPQKEVRNLVKLVSDNRQSIYFQSKNFVYEPNTLSITRKIKPKKNIPQDIIDKIR